MPGPPTPDPSHGPGGLIVIMRPDPAAAARALAHEHGIDVTIGGVATTEVIDRLLELVEAPTGHPVGTDVASHPTSTDPVEATGPADGASTSATPGTADGSDEAASTGAPTGAPGNAVPTHRPTDAELDVLAAGMRRSDALRDRTRQRVADDLCTSLNSSLAIHPDTLRQAATELIDATHALDQARAGRPPGAPQTRAAHAGTVGAVGAFGAAATAVGLAVAWPAGLAVAGVGAVRGLARHRSIRRTVRRELPGLEAAEALARRRWERLAGAGADPADLDAVIRRYDPHTDVIGDLLSHHPAVRAAQRVADDRRQAWVEAWQLAVDDPRSARSLLDHDHGDAPTAAASPDQAAGPSHGDGADATPGFDTSGEPTARSTSDDASHDEATRTVPPVSADRAANLRIAVVVSPYDGLTEAEAHDLHDRLLELPATVEVVVVLGNDVLDGISEAPTASPTDADDLDPHEWRIIDLTSRSVLPWPTGGTGGRDGVPLGASADIG